MVPSYEWRAPAPPPPWATVSDDDYQKTKNLKVEFAFQYNNMLFFWEKYRAKQKYCEELERFVQQYKEDIAKKDNIIEDEGKEIEEMQDEITDLDHQLSDTGDELEATRKLLEEAQDKLVEKAELNKDIMDQMRDMIKRMEAQ